MILVDHFEATARKSPERRFACFTGETKALDRHLTYGQAERRASAVARDLQDRGIGRGDVVMLMLPNSVDWLVWYAGNQKIGAITCGMNTALLALELAQTVVEVQPRLIVATPELADKARSIAVHSQNAVEVVVADPDRPAEQDPFPRDPELDQSDIAAIISTSGTSGSRPKAVLVPHRTLMNGIASYQDLMKFRTDDRIMVVTPLFHGAALNWAVSLIFLSGASAVIAEKFSASRFWEQAERGGTTVLWTMAAIPFILLNQERSETEKRVLKHLRMIFAVGAATRWRAITERWGPILFDGFGMSETPGTLIDASDFDHSEPFPCVGRPVPGIDLRIADPETGETCPPRDRGEIVVRFGQGFAGYLNNPQATAEAVRDGWFHTGDIAYADETGRIFFVDRIKDIIRRGSENLSAREIEQVLGSHPDVLEAYAVAKPDPVLGEIVAAFLVPRTNGRVFSLGEIREFCADKLSPLKHPVDVRTVAGENLARTPTGRVQKFRLKEMLRNESDAVS